MTHALMKIAAAARTHALAALAIVAVSLAGGSAIAQQVTQATEPVVSEPATVASQTASDEKTKRVETATKSESEPHAAKPSPSPALSRWLDVQTATINFYYYYITNSRGVATYNQMRDKEVFRARLKFDAKGRYSLVGQFSSGNSFTNGLNNTGPGRATFQSRHALRQLFLAAKPADWIELQVGGLGFNRGESTEATTYDDDGFMTGYRAVLRSPRRLFFDEISATAGYLGDFQRLNATSRMRRLKNFNYFQFLVTKNFEKHASISADFTSAAGVTTLRQGLRLSTSRWRVADSVRVEAYQRVDTRPDFGFVVRADRRLARRLNAWGGFGRIDRAYGGLNADRFPAGKRVFGNLTYTLAPELSLNLFASRAVANPFSQSTRTRVDLFFSYNLLKTLQKTHWF